MLNLRAGDMYVVVQVQSADGHGLDFLLEITLDDLCLGLTRVHAAGPFFEAFLRLLQVLLSLRSHGLHLKVGNVLLGLNAFSDFCRLILLNDGLIVHLFRFFRQHVDVAWRLFFRLFLALFELMRSLGLFGGDFILLIDDLQSVFRHACA